MSGATTFEYLIVGGLQVSLQRYPLPADGWIDALPFSCGALPMIVTANGLVTTCPVDEALWLGLVGARGTSWTVRVEVSLASGATLDAVPEGVHVPPAFAVAGVPRDAETRWPFTRNPEVEGAPSCRSMAIHARQFGSVAARAVRVEFVGDEEFHALTGEHVWPLDERAAYGSWRLP